MTARTPIAERGIGNLAAALRRARHAAGMSQTDVANATGLNRSTIANSERGARHPSPEVVEKWAAACGFDLLVVLVPKEGGR